MQTIKCGLLFFSLIYFHLAFGADTLKVSLQKADEVFLAKNYYLLAKSMNVEEQKAQILQAKIYPNPIFTADINAYDPQNNKAFHVGQTGQKSFQFEQLILLGGKRKAEIDLAKLSAERAEIEFTQLTRELKFQLHSSLFTNGEQILLLKKYNEQLSLLSGLLDSYQIQADKGNIPLAEVVRLKGTYLRLNNDKTELLKDYYDIQTTLQTLLQTNDVVEFEFTESDIEKYIKTIEFTTITDEAQQNRPELLLAEQDKLVAEQNLSLQKRQVVPDINLFTSYDQRGGAFNNQVNAGIAIPIPLWNRNQGAISAAKYRIEASNYMLKANQEGLYGTLFNAYSYYNHTVEEYNKVLQLYNGDFETTLKGMTDNFLKRNVSIIEFVDFFEAYNDVLTELTRVKTRLIVSGEKLNLLIGKDLY